MRIRAVKTIVALPLILVAPFTLQLVSVQESKADSSSSLNRVTYRGPTASLDKEQHELEALEEQLILSLKDAYVQAGGDVGIGASSGERPTPVKSLPAQSAVRIESVRNESVPIGKELVVDGEEVAVSSAGAILPSKGKVSRPKRVYNDRSHKADVKLDFDLKEVRARLAELEEQGVTFRGAERIERGPVAPKFDETGTTSDGESSISEGRIVASPPLGSRFALGSVIIVTQVPSN